MQPENQDPRRNGFRREDFEGTFLTLDKDLDRSILNGS